LKNEKLHFYSSIAAAPKPDLVIASGSLQYCQSPVSVLDELKKLQVHIILDRVPIVERSTFNSDRHFTLQGKIASMVYRFAGYR
jgi:putative methyltransferase (TIGR04325 family)